jgi:glycosyltransferase involved in cell wall biosynthesis
MRIAYITPSPVPSPFANSTQVAMMTAAFSAEGHRVLLCAPRGRDSSGASREDVATLYGVDEDFSFSQLTNGLGGWSFPVGALRESRRFGCELVYTRCLKTAFIASLAGTRFVLELHGPIRGRGARVYFAAIVRSRSLDRLVVISDALRRLVLSEHPGLTCEIRVAHDGVHERFRQLPLDSSAAKRRLGLHADRLVVGYAGSLYPGRGIEKILDLASRFPAVTFLIVGGTAAEIEHWKRSLTGALPNIVFTGFVPSAEVAAHVEASDILLMPYGRVITILGKGNSAGWCSPLKMFEYLGSGRPIIASDLPVLREVLQPNQNAVLCDPDNIGLWDAALKSLIEDGERRKRIGARGRADAGDYTWRERARRVLNPAGAAIPGRAQDSTTTATLQEASATCAE